MYKLFYLKWELKIDNYIITWYFDKKIFELNEENNIYTKL